MPEGSFSPMSLRMVAMLRSGQYERCGAYIEELLRTHSPEALYLNTLMPAIFALGEQVLAGKLAAAEIVAPIACVRAQMEVARGRMQRRPRLGKSMLATFLPGDIEHIGLVAISHWLDRDGWDVTYTYPPPPRDVLVADILKRQPTILAISCGMPKHVVTARHVIQDLRAGGYAGVIWLGGMGINVMPDLFARSGADHTAPNIVAFTRKLAEIYGYQTATPAEIA